MDIGYNKPGWGLGAEIRNRRNLESQNLAQQKCTKILPWYFKDVVQFRKQHASRSPPENNSKHLEAKKDNLTSTNQSPKGNNNQYSRCILVLVPQSGSFVSTFAVLFENWCQIPDVPDPPPLSPEKERRM